MPEEPAFEAFVTANQLRPVAPAPHKRSLDQVRESGVDVLRLSCIVRNNLEAEAEGGDYNAASTTGAPLNDVQINHQDAELDFDAKASEQGARSTPPLQRQSPGSAGLRDSGPETSGPTPADSDFARQGPSDDPPSAEPILPASAPRHSTVSMAAAGAPEEVVKAPETDDAQHLASLVWHASDLAVKPIVANRRIERLPEPRWDPRAIPFAILTMQQMMAAGQHDLERFLTDIYRVISSTANPLKDKVNVLAYLETLCIDTGAANQLVNSSLAILFVRMLRTSRAPALRVRLASVLGLLVRHATYIADELSQSGIIDVLAEGLRDENERVRRRMMATLGELLFYAATQNQARRKTSPSLQRWEGMWHASCMEGSNPRVWQVADTVFTSITRLLRPNEDDIAQHYAVKTIENLVSQGGMWASKFSSQEVANALLAILATERKGEAPRFTAASTLSRLAHHSEDILAHTLAQTGTGLIISGIRDSNAGIQRPMMNVLNLALSHPRLSAWTQSLLQDGAPLMDGLAALLDSSSSPLRAKAILALALLTQLSPTWLLAAFRKGILTQVEKLQKEKEAYISEAAGVLRAEVAATVPHIIQQLTFVPNSAHLSHFKADLLHALEAITAQADLLLDLRGPVLESLVPALAQAIRGEQESGDARFLCLKLLCDITLPFLASDGQEASGADSESMAVGGVVDSAVRDSLLPLMPELLEEPEPMPLYAQKLLTHLLDASPAWADDLRRLGLVSRFFDFLGLDEANNNVHNIRLCRQIVAAGAAPAPVISQLQAVDKVGAVLAYAAENSVDTFLEPVLELSLALLDQEAVALEQNLPGAGELKMLAPALLLLLELCQHSDAAIAEAAAVCTARIASLHPSEAAGLLLCDDGINNLSAAIGMQLESGGNLLVQQHLLNSLSTACRTCPNATLTPGQVEQLQHVMQALAINNEQIKSALSICPAAHGPLHEGVVVSFC
ncbi:hypothetical protein WJX84_005420 [Apatococcus fuscideae]|uniref:Uncharacterized protein n=1 Tax=Apatococcus fuscideae TaxID=2026836 RepID=A0AAW1SRP4_9CHLO